MSTLHFLVFQHVDVEHPGVFRKFWHDDNISWTAIELDAGEHIPENLDEFDALIVLGGPQDVWQEDIHPWLQAEKAAIRHWVVDLARPYLGICLGHQLLAEVLGGDVALMPAPEVGIGPIVLNQAGQDDPLFHGIPATFECLHWHGAEVTHVPEQVAILGANAVSKIQAMRWGKWAYGLQCHIEITAESVNDWHEIPEYRTSIEALLGPGTAEHLAATAQAQLPALQKIAHQLHRNFIKLIT